MGMDTKKTNQGETNEYVLATGTLYSTRYRYVGK
jgi:hypothetical protein